jgi:hypothetical protein
MIPNLRFMTIVAALLGVPAVAGAAGYYLCTDVQATLGGTDYTPTDIFLNDNGVYSLQLDLGDPQVQLSGVERRSDGLWVLSPAVPAEAAGPRDVVLTDGITLTPYFDGNAAGVPEYARIDALLLDAGALVLSFDVPVNLGGVEYGPADLVRWNAPGFSLYWNAEAAGVPPESNVVGAGLEPLGHLVVTFDVPTRLGGTDYLPGELVQWNSGPSFTSYSKDPAWPPSAQLRDFGFLPPVGPVPDGASEPGTPLTITRAAPSLTLSWGDDCPSPGDDYEVYEGALGSPFVYSHTMKQCTTGGATSATFMEPAGNVYYLVVKRNVVSEGSYGRSSDGSERPQGAAACLPRQAGPACP